MESSGDNKVCNMFGLVVTDEMQAGIAPLHTNDERLKCCAAVGGGSRERATYRPGHPLHLETFCGSSTELKVNRRSRKFSLPNCQGLSLRSIPGKM